MSRAEYSGHDIGTGPFGLLGNIIWLVLAGWWLALAHLITAILLAITIVGIPFAWAHLKLAGIALWPIGKEIVPVGCRAGSGCPRVGELKRLPHPHLIVVKRRAAERRDGVGAGQRIDAAAVGVSRIGPDRFRDQHAAAHAVEQFGVEAHFAAPIAERDHVAGLRCQAVPRRRDGSSPPAAARRRAMSASR